MPTIEEYDELFSNTTSEWGTINGVYGIKITGKISGYTNNWIFLPAAGYRIEDYIPYKAVSSLAYWSSSLYLNDPGYSCRVYGLYLYSYSSYYSYSVFSADNGLSVRPVSD